MTATITDRLLVPLANQDDATATCHALRRYFNTESKGTKPTVTVLHIIEKSGGGIDKAPMDTRKAQAEKIFAIAESILEPNSFTIETEMRFATDIVEAILDVGDESESTAIAFLPRKGGRIARFLSGNLTNKLVAESPIPVLLFPQKDSLEG